MRVTKQQLKFLHEIEQLDRIQLGCLEVSNAWTRDRARHIERQCIARGWIRTEPFREPWRRVMHLTTRGLRRLQRSHRSRARYQPPLPLGVAAEALQ